MRPLTLHTSALNDAEYTLYISCLRDLSEDDSTTIQHDDPFYQDLKVGVREARAWLRGRYSGLAPGTIDSILRLFCPNLGPADLLTGGQFLAVLRLVHHVLGGKEVDKSLVFVQAYPEPPYPAIQPPLLTTSRPAETRKQGSDVISEPPSPDVNPFSQSAPGRNPPPSTSAPTPSLPSIPPAVPPKPNTNPFLARRGSETANRPSPLADRNANGGTNARARSAASLDGRTPPLPPRKPTVPIVPPPRHSSQAHHSGVPSGSSKPNVLIQQSLQATRVAQSLKKAEQRLEQERVLEVLKSSNSNSNGTRRTRSISPVHNSRGSSKASSVASSIEREESAHLPVLPPRYKSSPPASVLSGSTSRSLEQVARASVPFKPSSGFRSLPPPNRPDSRVGSPTRTPPRPLTELPLDPPPTHPDRKPTLAGLDGERVVPSPESPRVFRSKSMHHPSPPPVPPFMKKRPESVQLAPTVSPAESPFASPANPNFPSSTSSHPPLSRHHSVSSSFSARSQRSEGSTISEPIANLHKTLSNLHQKAQPHLDSARYKAEAAFNPRGFVQHSQPRWMRQDAEERLIDGYDNAGEGQDDAESLDQDIAEESVAESDLNERLRRLRMGDAASEDRVSDGGSRGIGIERDDLKWPVGEGWKRL